jgi:hypothetical protein
LKFIIETIVIVILGLTVASLFEKRIASFIRFIRKCMGKEFIKEFLIDDNGIDVIDVGIINGKKYGKQYHPVLICHKALDLLEDVEANKNQFISIANWIATNIKSENNYFLQYNFPYPRFNMIHPWFSGMAQGRALEVLAHAYNITRESDYLNCAENIIESLFISFDDGGTTLKTENDGWWFVEYPSKEVILPRVLNGMMYTIMGLIVFYRFTKNIKAKFLLDQGILALERNIHLYDKKGDSYYHSLGRLTGGDYHSLHVKQLKIIYEYTRKSLFLDYHNKWNSFQNQIYPIRLFKKPDKMNSAVFFIGISFAIILISVFNIFFN